MFAPLVRQRWLGPRLGKLTRPTGSDILTDAYRSLRLAEPASDIRTYTSHALSPRIVRSASGPALNNDACVPTATANLGRQVLARRGFATNHQAFNNFDLLTTDEHLARIDGYGENGFLVNGVEYHTPILCFGKLTFAWHVSSLNDVNMDSLAMVALLKPAPDVVIFGTGATSLKIPEELIEALRKAGTTVDVMSTANACTTFNILNQESRAVACALLLDVEQPTVRA
mmetsp:Transcript_13684/g.23152  ORF Transcript_13684/g.23152 Transcript_13684/m.23152 type:complete len:228 (+) Transcript_13684:151-834(+)